MWRVLPASGFAPDIRRSSDLTTSNYILVPGLGMEKHSSVRDRVMAWEMREGA